MQITCAAEGDWPETGALTNAAIGCGAGFFGERTRFCDVTGAWGEVVEKTKAMVCVARWCEA